MKSILEKFLRKKGIDDLSTLTKDERVVYENYDKILSKSELTIEDLKHFLKNQIDLIENKWKEYDYLNKSSLIPYHTVYKSILQAIDAPQNERLALEQYLKQQI